MAVSTSPPTNLTVTSVTSTSITITWGDIPCLDRNFDISFYRVVLRPVPVRTDLGFFSYLSRNNVFTAAGLFPRTNYTVNVAAEMTNTGSDGPSATVALITEISQDVDFFATASFLPNNSVVVSENFMYILHCITNLTTCCTESDGGVAGEWFLPGQTQAVASFTSSSTSFYTQGVPSAVALKNFRRVAWPIGIYTCQIPDASGELRTSYIGVDTVPPVITGLEYNSTLLTLTCTSVGGPVNSVTWTRDGAEVGLEFTQTQTLIDTASATYQNILSADKVADFAGTFTCEVWDVAGNTDSRTLVNAPTTTQTATADGADTNTDQNPVNVGLVAGLVVVVLVLIGAGIVIALLLRKRTKPDIPLETKQCYGTTTPSADVNELYATVEEEHKQQDMELTQNGTTNIPVHCDGTTTPSVGSDQLYATPSEQKMEHTPQEPSTEESDSTLP